MKAWLFVLVSAATCAGVHFPADDCQAVGASLVVMQANPFGAPALGNQYLIGIQVSGLTEPTFLGTNLVTFSGSVGRDLAPGAFAAQPAQFYSGSSSVLFSPEADLSATIDGANYQKRNDSYFHSNFKTLRVNPIGAAENASSLSISGGVYGGLPYEVPGNSTYGFAYINVTDANGVQIAGELAVGEQSVLLGNGAGLHLSLSGVIGQLGDYNSDGAVNAADYVTWRKGEALQNDPTLGVQPEDYDFWRSQFGETGGSSAVTGAVPATIPEPSSLGLLAIAIWCNPKCQSGGLYGACGNS